MHLARIIHIEVNNLPSGPFDMLTVPSPVEGLRLRGSTELAEVPACAGRRPGLALSWPWDGLSKPAGAAEPAPAGALFTIHEGTQFVNNTG